MAGAGTTTIGWDVTPSPMPLSNGANRVITLTYNAHFLTLRAAGTMTPNSTNMTNNANVAWQNASNANFSTSAISNVQVVHPSMRVVKAVSSATVQPDDTVTYTIDVINDGPGVAYDVCVNDNQADTSWYTTVGTPTIMASGTSSASTVFPFSSGCSTASGAEQTWQFLGPIQIGAANKVRISYQVKVRPGTALGAANATGATVTRSNTASITRLFGASVATRDPGTAAEPLPVAITSSAATTPYLPVPHLAKTIELSQSPGTFVEVASAAVNTPSSWQLVVTNRSAGADAVDIKVVDRLPKNWAYQAGSTTAVPSTPTLSEPTVTGTASTGQTLTWLTARTLAPGASFTIRIRATANSSVNVDAPSANLARASSIDVTGVPGGTPTSDPYTSPDDPATAIFKTPVLKITKNPKGAFAPGGGSVPFTIKVTNAGVIDATGATDIIVQFNFKTNDDLYFDRFSFKSNLV